MFIYRLYPGFPYGEDPLLPILEYERLWSLQDSGSVTGMKAKVLHCDSASLDSEGFVWSVNYGTSFYNNYW
jgi:hypothetical protein